MQLVLFYLILLALGYNIYAKQQENIRADAELLSEVEVAEYETVKDLCQLWMKDLLILGVAFSDIQEALHSAIVEENGSCEGIWGSRYSQKYSAPVNFWDACFRRQLLRTSCYFPIQLDWEKARQVIQKNQSVTLPKKPANFRDLQATYYSDSQIFVFPIEHQETLMGRLIMGIGVSLPNGNCLVFSPSIIRCSQR